MTPDENKQTVEALYDPGTHEEIRARFQAADDAEGVPMCFHSKMDLKCVGCLWGQLERSEYIISDYRAALRDLVAQADRAAELEREVTKWRGGYAPELEELEQVRDRTAELEAALRETLNLAAVGYEGDSWYAEDAMIDAEAVFARARAALAGDGGGA